jgi:hypothetical protein
MKHNLPVATQAAVYCNTPSYAMHSCVCVTVQLFKSEMFSWLNRYLTMGIMPDEQKAADVVAKAEAPKRGTAAAAAAAAVSAVGGPPLGSRLAAVRQSGGPAALKQAAAAQP